MEFVKVIVTFYKGGKIVATDTGYTSLERLIPGQSSPFKVMSFTITGDGFDAYTIQAQGSQVR
jgi:hypothetical protein